MMKYLGFIVASAATAACIRLKSDGPDGTAFSIGSLPPVLHPDESKIPTHMLPSKFNVVTHEVTYGEDVPQLRTDCSGLLTLIEKSASKKNRDSAVKSAFSTIVNILSLSNYSDETDFKEEAIWDKSIDKSLSVLSSSTKLDWHFVNSLRNCAITPKGRTIFMELVLHGYTKSIDNVYSKKLCSIAANKLKDVDNNNLIHLAVMSKVSFVVQHVLSMFSPDDIYRSLAERNNDNMRPIDLANSYTLEDISDQLKKAWTVAKGAMDNRVMIKKISEMKAAMDAKIANKHNADAAAAEAKKEVNTDSETSPMAAELSRAKDTSTDTSTDSETSPMAAELSSAMDTSADTS